jgi:DnaJ-class molecular chaperone
MAQKRDYYEVLGVSREATADEIKRAYRQAAMNFHPDRGGDDPESERKFKEASEAYEVLVDLEKRNRYDRSSHTDLSRVAGHDFPQTLLDRRGTHDADVLPAGRCFRLFDGALDAIGDEGLRGGPDWRVGRRLVGEDEQGRPGQRAVTAKSVRNVVRATPADGSAAAGRHPVEERRAHRRHLELVVEPMPFMRTTK